MCFCCEETEFLNKHKLFFNDRSSGDSLREFLPTQLSLAELTFLCEYEVAHPDLRPVILSSLALSHLFVLSSVYMSASLLLHLLPSFCLAASTSVCLVASHHPALSCSLSHWLPQEMILMILMRICLCIVSDSSYSHPHTHSLSLVLVVMIKSGTQDQDFACSFSDSLSPTL